MKKFAIALALLSLAVTPAAFAKQKVHKSHSMSKTTTGMARNGNAVAARSKSPAAAEPGGLAGSGGPAAGNQGGAAPGGSAGGGNK